MITVLSAVAIAWTFSLTLASCSNQPTAPAASGTTSGVGAKWSECMRGAGFDVADADDALVKNHAYLPPADVDAEQFSQAADACFDELRIVGASDADKQKAARQFKEAENCIRENGYPDMPDSPEGTFGVSEEDYPRLAEEQFAIVQEMCLKKHVDSMKMKTIEN